ncbi:hypothetical protein NP493_87g02042 [Ridgeia piscesae]|uniref:Uncharacterized protein n=1 Tax=Ridgeia piscesae TaxID=27915 RepID=A0AAD9P8Y3_RIDPI|nr:hypothetical protein NP493_87g02042 [Ridgeia piscesae]
MDCRSSRGTFVAWDLRILDQLPEGVRACFPVVLTYACDWAVLSSLLNEFMNDDWLYQIEYKIYACILHPPKLVHITKRSPAAYFARRLFLRMPRKMSLTCPNCGLCEQLRSKGL